MSRRKRTQGFIVLSMMFFLTSLLALTAVGMTRSLTDYRASEVHRSEQQTFYLAEAGLDQALRSLRSQFTITGQLPLAVANGTIAVQAPGLAAIGANAGTFSRYEVSYDLDGDGTPENAAQHMLTTGTFAGMQASTQRVRITSQVTGAGGQRVCLEEVVEMEVVPIFQFAMFDHDDLSLQPGPAMTVTGPIFSNGTLSLHPVTGMTIDGTVRAAGDIIHNGTDTGYVNIKDGDGAYQDMRNSDGSWLESTDANWAVDAPARWGGRVQDHVAPVQFPIPTGMSPIEIIKPGEAGDSAELRNVRLYYKADLRIIDGTATDRNGHPVMLPAGTVSSATFWDAREDHDACVTQIDMQKLAASGLTNGKVVYVGSEDPPAPGCFHGVRLVNGSQLPSAGLMVVTHHPLYVQGDYNTAYTGSRPPAGLIGDAFTVLSNDWDDSRSTLPTPARHASDTTVNAGVMAGRAREQNPVLNSEHMIRFLEGWNHQTFTFTGSEISPWESDEASDDLACCGTSGAYDPPVRVWAFDASFMTLSPPQTPTAYTVVNSAWYANSCTGG